MVELKVFAGTRVRVNSNYTGRQSRVGQDGTVHKTFGEYIYVQLDQEPGSVVGVFFPKELDFSAEFQPGDRVFVKRRVPTNDGNWRNSWVSDMDKLVGKTAIVQRYNSDANDYTLISENQSSCVTNGVSEAGYGFGYPGHVLALVIPVPPQSRRITVDHVSITAKDIAVRLAKTNPFVTSDDVQYELVKLGYKSTDLGNAAGTLFKGGNWISVGTTLSKRPEARKRAIKKWQYVQ